MVDGRRNWVNSFRVIQCSSIPPSTIQGGDSSLMFFDNQDRSTRVALAVLMFSLTLLLMVCGPGARAQTPDITGKLSGSDSYMHQVLNESITPRLRVPFLL